MRSAVSSRVLGQARRSFVAPRAVGRVSLRPASSLASDHAEVRETHDPHVSENVH